MGDIEPSSKSLASQTTTTTTMATTTTAVASHRWFSGAFVSMIDSYNEHFGRPYEQHVNDLDYAEAQLDCVVAQGMLLDWRLGVNPAPNPLLQSLTDFFFQQLEGALDACVQAETLGDWRDVNQKLEEAIGVIGRIEETIYR